MSTTDVFAAKLAAFQADITALPDVAANEVQQAAVRLAEIHFTPTLLLPVERLLSLSKTDLLREIDRVAALTEADLRAQGIALTQTAED